jgi:hypothetical protein
MSGDYLKMLKKGVKEVLERKQKNMMVLPYMLFVGQTKTASMTKEQLQKKLFQLLPVRSLLHHVDYIGALSPVQKSAIDLYQSIGYVHANSYLRYGAIREYINPYGEDKPEYINAATFKNATSKYVSDQLKIVKKNAKEMITRKKTLFDKTRSGIKTLLSIIKNAPRVKTPFYVYRGEKDFKMTWSKSDDKYENIDDDYRVKQLSLKVGETYDMKSFGSFSVAPWVAYGFALDNTCCYFRLKIDLTVPCLIFLYTEQYKEFEVLLSPAVYKVTQVTFLESPLSPELKVKLYDVEFVKALKPKL